MIKNLFIFLLILAAAYLLREGYFFMLDTKKLPVGTTAGQVEVGGMTMLEAGEAVARAYAKPITLYNDTVGENIELSPERLGFDLDLDTMLKQLEEGKESTEWYLAFVGYVLRTPIRPINVELTATHDPETVRDIVETVSDLVAQPAQPPRIDPETFQFLPGHDGYSPDIETTVTNVESVLYQTGKRTAEYALIYEEEPPFDIELLRSVLEDQLTGYRSIVGGVYVRDLATGEEININGDMAVSGLSVVKIAILLETYRRAIDTSATFDQQKLINETAVFSGNYSANILLDYVAGENNAYLGVDILSESMALLGLENTFIVTPYEEPPRPGRITAVTPANQEPVIDTNPDPNMQTTASDMGTLLTMIYECAQGGGTLIAVYDGDLNPEECQSILDVLALNVEGNLIRFGVPNGTKVAHKHGWGGNTHGDAGVVFSEGGDYVLVTYLSEPASDWLVADFSFPILREMSRITYNYFNADDPYLGDALLEADRFDEDDPFFNTEGEPETEIEEEAIPVEDES